jgi:hypothetical protein
MPHSCVQNILRVCSGAYPAGHSVNMFARMPRRQEVAASASMRQQLVSCLWRCAGVCVVFGMFLPWRGVVFVFVHASGSL